MGGKEIRLGSSLLVPSVQELARESLSRVPPRYVRPHDDQQQQHPHPFLSPQLHVINLSNLYSPDFKASELPKFHSACRDWGFFQIGDFGILIRSGFSTSKALFFNFLLALVALVGTALALLWGKDPGQSSLIEGFTAVGFIYIAIAGVLAEMNNSEKTTLRSTMVHIISLTLGRAFGISLVE